MKRIAIVLLIQFLLFCHGAVLAETRGVTNDTIILGRMTADTGPIARDSQSISEGIKNYMSYINEQGGIHGRKIKLIPEDTGYSIPRAFAAFKKLLYRDRVFTISGPTSSGETAALYSQFQKEKICGLPMSASESAFNPFKRYIFMFMLTFENQVKILFDYMLVDMKARNPKVAVLYPDIEVGKAVIAEARKQANIYGVKLTEEVLNMNALDATTQVLSIKKSNPDFVIVQNHVALASLFLRTARKLGLNSNFLGTIMSTNDDVIALSKEAASGFVGVHGFAVWYNDTPGARKMRDITLKLCPGTEKPYRSAYYTMGWVNAMLFTEGMKRAGKDLNNEKLVDAMETIKDFDPWGLSGPVTWGPDDREGAESGLLYKADVDGGRMLTIGSWRKPRPR
jgi:branched-chain amino acid transport system substrate-binding protein